MSIRRANVLETTFPCGQILRSGPGKGSTFFSAACRAENLKREPLAQARRAQRKDNFQATSQSCMFLKRNDYQRKPPLHSLRPPRTLRESIVELWRNDRIGAAFLHLRSHLHVVLYSCVALTRLLFEIGISGGCGLWRRPLAALFDIV